LCGFVFCVFFSILFITRDVKAIPLTIRGAQKLSVTSTNFSQGYRITGAAHDDLGIPLQGKLVRILVRGKSYVTTTNQQGIFYLELKSDFQIGSETFRVWLDEDGPWDPTTIEFNPTAFYPQRKRSFWFLEPLPFNQIFRHIFSMATAFFLAYRIAKTRLFASADKASFKKSYHSTLVHGIALPSSKSHVHLNVIDEHTGENIKEAHVFLRFDEKSKEELASRTGHTKHNYFVISKKVTHDSCRVIITARNYLTTTIKWKSEYDHLTVYLVSSRRHTLSNIIKMSKKLGYFSILGHEITPHEVTRQADNLQHHEIATAARESEREAFGPS